MAHSVADALSHADAGRTEHPTSSPADHRNAVAAESAGDVRLMAEPFHEQEATQALRASGRGQVGAVVAFTGVVRRDEAEGAAVTQLSFETYPDMALDQLEAVRQEALARFALVGLTIWHRTDTLSVGDPIVLVAASARHRDAAFAAAAWAMDEVKRRVPLWKRETRSDGTEAWVHADSCTCGGTESA